ncbi:MAG TPA: TonB-dependent receptor, partial [Niabella sp.]|nr:TonB-dependent receptor [Niabella sp.]
IEAEVTGNPFPGFNFVSGYSYNDNKYIKSAVNLVGKRAVGAPRETANLWLSYSLLKGDLKGMGIGAGFLYVSETYLNNINTFTLPAYTILDATVFYNAGQYRISLKANNLTGTNYWVSDGFYARPQKPGNFLASIAWKF